VTSPRETYVWRRWTDIAHVGCIHGVYVDCDIPYKFRLMDGLPVVMDHLLYASGRRLGLGNRMAQAGRLVRVGHRLRLFLSFAEVVNATFERSVIAVGDQS
jgi:hypothetical protein